jgi:hypothetical protein
MAKRDMLLNLCSHDLKKTEPIIMNGVALIERVVKARQGKTVFRGRKKSRIKTC